MRELRRRAPAIPSRRLLFPPLFRHASARLESVLGTTQKRPPRLSHAVLFISCIVVFVCLFAQLGALGFTGPDEPRYAWIARAMAQTHDWVTPRLYGAPWFEKPILFYWAAAVGFLLHLPAEWAARLPSALAALTAAVAIGWLGFRHYERSIAFWSPAILAPLLFATSAAAIGFARAASTDTIFSGALILSMASAAAILRKRAALRSAVSPTDANQRGKDFLDLILFGAFLGAAALAKGPAAIILAGGAIGLWALATSQWKAAFRVAHPIAIVTFLLVALPWYIICARRNPDFVRVFIWQHNFDRYLTPVFQHRQPFWFFVPVVLLALLPWTGLLWLAAREGRRLWEEKSWRDSPGFFFTCWAIFPLVFFSFSQSKLPGYALPAIPPLALLCAIALIRTARAGTSRCATVSRVLGVTWVILGIAALVVSRRVPPGLANAAHLRAAELIGGVAALFAGIFIAVPLASLRKHFSVPLTMLSMAIAVEFANVSVLPSIDPLYSARPYAQLLRNDLHQDRIFTYHLARFWDFGLAFYFSRELPEWNPSDPEPALVLTQKGGLTEIREMGRTQGELEEMSGGMQLVPIAPARH
jgi:4-amino-4-deoxy-L-arabinose transferase-like glycosyltransferase